MEDNLIGGARVAVKSVVAPQLSEDERQRAEVEAERQEMARRLFFNGDPAAALMSLAVRVQALENKLGIEAEPVESEAVLERTLSNLERAQAEAKPEPVADEPPEAIADLFDPELTARQNQEALTKKYTALMNERQWWLEGGDDKSKAMELLRKAERIESGINWNRARLAEVV